MTIGLLIISELNFQCPYRSTPVTLKEAVSQLSLNIGHEVFEFHVRRDFVLTDVLAEMDRLAFDPFKKIRVRLLSEKFTGQPRGYYRIVEPLRPRSLKELLL